jgi:hypothetical protein
MVELKKVHWVVVKHVLQYLKGTVHFDLRYVGDGELELHGFTNSNWAGRLEEHFRVLLQFGFKYGFLVQQEASFNGT